MHALGIGGDDYLAKPFGMRELVARVQASLRRAGTSQAAAAAGADRGAGLVIDPDLHQAILDGADAGLTRTEFRLLYVLASEQGRALSRDQLQQRVWGMPYRHRDRTVDVCVRKLRQKLDRRSETPHLHPDALQRRLPVRAAREAGRHALTAAGAGSTTVIVVPPPGTDSIVARPPYSSAMCLTIASPRPVPGPERAPSTR